jgi:IS5 family transposase
MRKFMGLDFSEEGVPDATTLLNFRHLLAEKGLQKKIFEVVNELLEENGIYRI